MNEFRFGLVAHDYAASVAFYRDALGLPIHRAWDRGGDDRGTLLRAGPALIEIVPASAHLPAAAPVGVWLYLGVPDVDAAYARALRHGATAQLDPRDEPWGHRRATVVDPDGIAVGLFTERQAG